MTGVHADAPEQAEQTRPGFGERGRMRRRARFLRKARELAYRDLGGLVFDLHRFGQRNDKVVSAKLATLGQIDSELRALEEALDQHQPVTVLREVGIAACPRCAAIHGRDDRFCPGCGLPFDANAERPLAHAPVSAHPAASPASTGAHGPQASDPDALPAPAPGPVGSEKPAERDSSAGSASTPQTPPGKESAAPVAAPPASASSDKDEPTQILEPPVRGA